MALNQPLVGHIAKRYRVRGLSWTELISAGNVGLLQAVDRFNPSAGYKFSTFAASWIEGEIKQAFAFAKRQTQHDALILVDDDGEEYESPHLADQTTGVMGIDVDLVPALEQAIQQLEDPRQVMVLFHAPRLAGPQTTYIC